jgi:hypothetical protein
MPGTSSADDNQGIDKELEAAIKNNSDREEINRKAKILCRHAKVLFGDGWEVQMMAIASRVIGFNSVVMSYGEGDDDEAHLISFSATCQPISAFETDELIVDDEEDKENEEG